MFHTIFFLKKKTDTPLIVVAVFLAIVPMILELLAKWEGTKTISTIRRTVMKRYYLFIVVNVL
jgi:hypothetical protein